MILGFLAAVGSAITSTVIIVVRDGWFWAGNLYLYGFEVCKAERQDTEKVRTEIVWGLI